MAVRAPHLAFIDLDLDRMPSSVPDHLSDDPRLGGRIHVVEVQDSQVLLPAVDTGMSQQVGVQTFFRLRGLAAGLRDCSPEIVGLVVEVVLASVRGMTLPTVRIEGSRCRVLEGEA